MTPLNSSNDIPCIVLPWYDILFTVDNCQLACKLSTPNRWWLFQVYSTMQFQGAMTALNGSQDIPRWCIALISSSQLTTVNLCASCLPPIDDGSFKCPQRCSWRAVPGAMTALNGSNDRPWHCLIMTSHFQLTIGNSRASCLVSTPKRGGILQMSSKMQLTSFSRALETKYYDIVFAYI